uniref:Uncharacterized protein n=1 Tax=Panagrolaimus davidi TaxID=227884 RepID=A0A914PIU6_9BILA
MKCKRKIIQNVTCPYKISYILIPNFQLRNLSNDSIKIMQNNETLAVITPETKVTEHFIINSKDTNITVELETDSNLFGIYPTPSSKFSIVSFPELKTEVNHLSLTKFSYTVEIAFVKNTAKLITVIAPKEYTLEMFMAENIYFKDETANIIREFFVYESNSTKNLIFS